MESQKNGGRMSLEETQVIQPSPANARIDVNPIDLDKIKTQELDLAKRDRLLAKIEADLYAKRFMLIQKRKTLDNSLKQNPFLKDVVDDYNSYYDSLVRQKSEQQEAIEFLKKYLEDMLSEAKLTESQIEENSIQQDAMVNELKKIKGELKEILDYK